MKLHMTDWQVEQWMSDYSIQRTEYANYWNDEDVEKKKEWYILDGDFTRMESHLQETGLLRSLEECIGSLKTHFGVELSGTGIDLAAGNLWAVPHLFRLGMIEKLYCLEYSKHRLMKLGPRVLEHYNVPREKVVLVLGSFYDLHLEDESLDFALLSSAFHHADRPVELLAETRRILRPGAAVVIVGEHVVNAPAAKIRHMAKFFISTFVPPELQRKAFGKVFAVKSLIPRLGELFPVDPILGDHYYETAQYRRLFSEAGFRMKHISKPFRRHQAFILVKDRKSKCAALQR